MALSVVSPPEMRRLLRNAEFRGMMTRKPRLPSNLTQPGMTEPWHVWVLKQDGAWQRGRYFTYVEAYRTMRRKLQDETIMDVSIVSIRYMMAPPMGYKWNYRQYPWCPRCRRPSIFQERYSHRAIPASAELTTDDCLRCFYCGIRQAAFPRYSPR